MKYILIIGDGMADNALPELSEKTPLQYANTPAMDALASAGLLGTAKTVPEGMPPGSDTAILTIFGCDAAACYGGRAPLEAAASGIVLEAGDIAYRCNMVTFEDGDMPFEQKKIISHSAGSIEGIEADTLVRELWSSPEFGKQAAAAKMEIYPSGSFRHIAVGRDKGRKEELLLTPPHDHLGERIGELLPKGGEHAEILTMLMRAAHSVLDKHPLNISRRNEGKLPANGLWFWAEGIATGLPDFFDKYGKKGSVISAVPLCQGIGVLMGLKKITVEGATGMLDTNYEGKVAAAYEALKTDDFAVIHIEAPDECTHDGDLEGKLEAIRRIDSRVITPLIKKLRDDGTDFRMLILSDHKTLMSTRGHSGDDVPFLIYDSRCNKETGNTFCEKNALRGKYISEGTKLIGLLFNDE